MRAQLPTGEILAPDLPGFGREPALKAEPDLAAMAAHIAKPLEDYERIALAGFSMGGYVALAFAEQFPEQVAGLALISSQPFADSDEVRKGRRTMIERVKGEGVSAAVNAALPKMFSPGPISPELAAYPAQGAARAGVAGITWALESMARRPDRTALFEKLAVPRLLLHGTADQFIPVDRVRGLASRLAVPWVELNGVGHCTPLEKPSEVAKALRTFWAEASSNG